MKFTYLSSHNENEINSNSKAEVQIYDFRDTLFRRRVSKITCRAVILKLGWLVGSIFLGM